MNLLLMTHRFPPDGVAGVERVAQDLADCLARRTHRVTVVTRQRSRRLQTVRRREVLPTGVVVDRITGRVSPITRPYRGERLVQRAFLESFTASTPNVVHVLHPYGFSPACFATVVRHQVPLVVSLHDYFFACQLAHLEKRDGRLCGGPNGGLECASTCFAREGADGPVRWTLRTSFFRRLLALASVVVAPSKYVADYFSGDGYLRKEIHVVPNGIRPASQLAPARVQNGHGDDELRLAYIGVVTAHKGVHLIIEAAAAVDRRAVSLLVAGDQPDRRYVRRLRRLATRVPRLTLRFTGRYEPSELSELLTGIDVVVIPSRVPEAFSMTAREALARGVPVVVADIGALPEAIEEGVTGWTFVPNSVSSLAEVLRRLATNRAGIRNARRAATTFRGLSVDDYADRMLGLYALAIRSPSRISDAEVMEAVAVGEALVAVAS